jgi:hypothetical protein
MLFLILTVNFNEHVIMNMAFSSNMHVIQNGLLAQNM